MVIMKRTPSIFLSFGAMAFRSLTTVGAFSAQAPFPTAHKSTGQNAIPVDQALAMEATVRRYFEGVHTKDAGKIRSCFGDTATIRDVCGLNANQRTVDADILVERCMDFVTAHPACAINFYYGPTCGRSTTEEEGACWVVAHCYETGTWSGESCGIAPQHTPIACEGQTRFRVDPTSMKITEFVVTRTFTAWEKAFIEQQKAQAEEEQSS